MGSRERILARLKVAHRQPADHRPLRTVPAMAIGDDIVTHFIRQAEKNGATVQRQQREQEVTLDDTAFYTRATIAVAETGSIGVDSHVAATHKLYLCDHLYLGITEHNIVRYLHDALRIAGNTGARAFHLITGPSRTADVEQTIQIGAHGPKQLTIMIYRDDS
jgi:L-lactate utilization protein LutC